MSANPFSLLQEVDESDVPVPKQKEEARVRAPAPTAAATTAAPAPARGPRSDAPSRGGGRGDVRDNRDRRPAGHGPAAPEDARREREQRPPRERTAERTARPGKRAYDRHSGTGRSATENKKGGAGKGNWGVSTDEGVDVPVAQEEARAETAPAGAEVEGEAEAEVATNGDAIEAEEAAGEPEKKELTMDEYLALKAEAKPVIQLNQQKVRKAGEGVDQKEQKQWKQYVEVKRDETEEEYFSAKPKASPTAASSSSSSINKKKKKKKAAAAAAAAAQKAPPKAKAEKVAVDEVLNVSLPPPETFGGGERGGRRGGRGGSRGGARGGARGAPRGGRGGARGASSSSGNRSQFVFDENAFPTLATPTA